MITKKLFHLFLFLTIVSFGFSQENTINVTVTNIRNAKGLIQIQIYKDVESYGREVPWKVVQLPKDKVVNKTLKHTIKGLPDGTYGLALLDDENSDTKMNWTIVKLPKEGFGFSNYYHSVLSKPKFDNFKFYLKGNKDVEMKIRYVL